MRDTSDKLNAHRARMHELAAKTDLIASRIPSGSILVDYPIYRNIGDILIHRGSEAALARQQVQLRDRFAYPDLGKIQGGTFHLGRRFAQFDRMMADCPMLLFQGGGNLGDLWPNHQLLREALIARYPHVPCTILPQSAHFGSEQALDQCRRIFGAHRQLTLYCRDQETMAALGSAVDCSEAPDMAHGLWETLPRRSAPKRSGLLVQSRRDPERAETASPENGFDWDDCEPKAEVVIWRALVTTRRFSALGSVRAAGDALWNRLADRWLGRAIERVGSAEALQTDRLHGLILATLLETPVRFSDNKYGKLGRYAACWFGGDPLIVRH